MADPQYEPGETWESEGTESLYFSTKPDWVDFQDIGSKTRSPYFFSKASVGGFLRSKSRMMTKTGMNGKDTDFMFIVMDMGPVYAYSVDPVKNETRNVVTCVLFGAVARKAETAIRDMNAKLLSRPWMMIEGTLEAGFSYVDPEDHSKGTRADGTMKIRATNFFCPPIPRLSRVRPEFRDDDFDDGPGIVV